MANLDKKDEQRLQEIFDEATTNYKYKWGIEEFNKVLKRYPDIEDEDVLCRLGLLYDHSPAANKEEKKGYEEKAIELYEKVLSFKPESYRATWGIARVYWHRASEKAIPYAKKAYELAKENKENYGMYAQQVGLVYENLGKYEEAEKWLLKGLELEPESWDMYLNLVIFYRLTENFEKSKEIAKKLDELYRKEAPEFRNTAWGKKIQEVIDNADKPLPKAKK